MTHTFLSCIAPEGMIQSRRSEESMESCSELEEIYEQFWKWLDDPIHKDSAKKLDPRDEILLKFASSILKRTLSESYMGMPLTEGCIESTCQYLQMNTRKLYHSTYSFCQRDKILFPTHKQSLRLLYLSIGIPAEQICIQTYQEKKNRIILNPRSLSLELAKHSNRTTVQPVS